MRCAASARASARAAASAAPARDAARCRTRARRRAGGRAARGRGCRSSPPRRRPRSPGARSRSRASSAGRISWRAAGEQPSRSVPSTPWPGPRRVRRTPPRPPAARPTPSASSRRPASVSVDAARRAHEQLDAELGLELPDRLAQRRRGHVQPVGRAREAELLGDRDEVAQVAQLGHGPDHDARRRNPPDRVFLRHGAYRPAHAPSPSTRHRQRPPRLDRLAALDSAEPLRGTSCSARRRRCAPRSATTAVVADPFPHARSSAAARVDVLSSTAPRSSAARPRALLEPARRLRRADHGEVTAPGRNELTMPDEAFLLGMPGRLRDGAMTVKVVTVFESPRPRATWRRSGSTTRAPAPARRSWTAPTSPRSARARPPRSPPTCSRARTRATLAIIGAGVQGEHHLRTFPLVRDFDEIRVSSLYARGRRARRGAAPARARRRRSRGRGPRRGRRRARHPRRAAGDRAGLDRARARTSARSATARRTASCPRAARPRDACSSRPARRSSRPRSAARSCRAWTRRPRPSSARSCSARARAARDAARDHRLQGDGPRRRGHRRRRARLRRGAPSGAARRSRSSVAARLRSLAMNLSRPARAVPPTLPRRNGVQPSSRPLRARAPAATTSRS